MRESIGQGDGAVVLLVGHFGVGRVGVVVDRLSRSSTGARVRMRIRLVRYLDD